MNLRTRKSDQAFSGFTDAEVQKMEQLLNKSKDRLMDVNFFKELTRNFNQSSNRSGKPTLKWTEIQSWFRKNQKCRVSRKPSFDATKVLPKVSKALTKKKTAENSEILEDEKGQDIFKLEFEARSSIDGAWYDVDAFLSHRFLSSGEIEVYVRYAEFGAEEDEWVNVRKHVRLRSVALEHSECHKVKVGDQVLCFQESEDQARYYDAHVMEIKRRLHDVRGCRCLFLITYDHDNTAERVPLQRLCCRPDML